MKPHVSRNLFTGDSCFFFHDFEHYNPEGGPYTADLLDRFADLLATSGIDTHLVNPNTQVAWYPSRVVPTLWEGYQRGDREFFRGQARINMMHLDSELLEEHIDRWVKVMGNYLDLVEAGVDWPTALGNSCRRRGVKSWFSVRMNDMHNSYDPEHSFFSCPLMKDARYRLRGRYPNPRRGAWDYFAGLNYACPEVRDYMFAMIRELVEDYDYQGMELDWLRNPLCCEPQATARNLDMMTEWTAEIRRLTRRKAAATGREYPLGMRMTGGLGQMRSIGLDIQAWVAADLIDFVSVSNFWQSSWDIDHHRVREQLGGDIAIYGGIEAAPNGLNGYTPGSKSGNARMTPASAPTLRGNAAGKLVTGADGIEHFNFFVGNEVSTWGNQPGTTYETLRDLEKLESLRGKPKHYTLQTHFAPCWIQPYEFPEPLPVLLEPSWRRAFSIPMCAEPTGDLRELIIQIVLEREAFTPDIGISFNGCWPNYSCTPTDELLFPFGQHTHHLPDHQAFNFEFRPEAIHEGWNEIVVYNDSTKRATREERRENTVCVMSVELAVR